MTIMRRMTMWGVAAWLLLILTAGAAWAAEALEEEPPEQVEGAVTIGVEEARQLWKAGAAFVDVRSPKRMRETGTIPGAFHLPLDAGFSEESLAKVVLDRNAVVVLFCDKGLRSAVAVEEAAFWNYPNLKYFRSGLRGWDAQGLPIAK